VTARRPVLRWAVAGVLAAVALAAVLVAALGGGEARSGDAGPLQWSGAPVAFVPETLPQDRIVTGKVRNGALEGLRLDSRRDVRVVGSDGRALPATVVFTQTYGHSLFSPARVPVGRLPEFERARIGNVGRFRPGDVRPFTVAWREPPGAPAAVRIEYKGGVLAIPSFE
jgi:hypothetical protein